ncbi:hypothetical protein GJAV_G00144070 [Gymnothorax javanicus]|nr:hypothetical protein GJAV_G00144070 [Gymnothorax javanicus]
MSILRFAPKPFSSLSTVSNFRRNEMVSIIDASLYLPSSVIVFFRLPAAPTTASLRLDRGCGFSGLLPPPGLVGVPEKTLRRPTGLFASLCSGRRSPPQKRSSAENTAEPMVSSYRVRATIANILKVKTEK